MEIVAQRGLASIHKRAAVAIAAERGERATRNRNVGIFVGILFLAQIFMS